MTTAPTITKPRIRRSDDQRMADLQAEMELLRQKQASRENNKAMADTEDGQATIRAVRAIDHGIRSANKAGNRDMLKAFESARATLGSFAAHRYGIRITEPRLKVGGRTRKHSS